ncbi:MAG TPA: hypothetical protein GXZ70_06640 [Clostridiales bacterium]|nr:hypothetical protein [Clostridiales bacterium]
MKLGKLFTRVKIAEKFYQYEDMVITENIKMLLCRFLMERKNRIVEIYKKKEGINE